MVRSAEAGLFFLAAVLFFARLCVSDVMTHVLTSRTGES